LSCTSALRNTLSPLILLSYRISKDNRHLYQGVITLISVMTGRKRYING
jgi:hypothetical protein